MSTWPSVYWNSSTLALLAKDRGTCLAHLAEDWERDQETQLIFITLHSRQQLVVCGFPRKPTVITNQDQKNILLFRCQSQNQTSGPAAPWVLSRERKVPDTSWDSAHSPADRARLTFLSLWPTCLLPSYLTSWLTWFPSLGCDRHTSHLLWTSYPFYTQPQNHSLLEELLDGTNSAPSLFSEGHLQSCFFPSLCFLEPQGPAPDIWQATFLTFTSPQFKYTPLQVLNTHCSHVKLLSNRSSPSRTKCTGIDF